MTTKTKIKTPYKWGVGLEHESYMFHINFDPNIISNKLWDPKCVVKSFILCPLEGPASEVIKRDFSSLKNKKTGKFLSLYDNKLASFFKTVVDSFEPTGRRCNNKVVLSPLPGTYKKYEQMPEFISYSALASSDVDIDDYKSMKFFFHHIDNFSKLYRFTIILEEELKDFKIRSYKYGFIDSFPFGMSSYIKLPKNYKGDKYDFHKKLFTDYLGSYHTTITLPYTIKTSEKQFIKYHQNFANMIQWLEPLFVSSFFSCHDQCMGRYGMEPLPRGSFRVVQVGWGNFAGTDLRKIKDGVGRYATTNSKWRKGLKFKDSDITGYCWEKSQKLHETEPNAKSSFSTDIRTIGSPDHKTIVPMRKGYGIEIRIFDNFPSIHLFSLLKILTYIAEHSRKNTVNEYVYDNKIWIKTTQDILMNGWSTIVDQKYIQLLRQHLNLKIKTKNRIAYHVFKTIVEEIYHLNKDGLWCKYMLNTQKYKFDNPPFIPEINRLSWHYGFIMKLYHDKNLFMKFNEFYTDITDFDIFNNIVIPLERKYKISNIFNIFIKHMPLYRNDFKLVLDFLSELNLIKLYYNDIGDIVEFSTSMSLYNKYKFDKYYISTFLLYNYLHLIFEKIRRFNPDAFQIIKFKK